MCSPQNTKIIRDILTATTADNEPFTAYDITLAARRKGVRERHDDIKQVVHDVYANSEMPSVYIRSIVNLTGGAQPFLYHPTWKSPRDYERAHSTSRSGMSSPPSSSMSIGTATATATVPAASMTTAVTANSEEVTVDRRHRIWVPCRFLRALGLDQGDEVFVWYSGDPSEFYVTATAPNNPCGTVYSYLVDRYGNIGISQSAITEFVMSGDKFLLEAEGNLLTISEAN
jgi:bifunctional DNA-binding transcriptional regulator/antitoxin component of YhaV-PrlF toxin-antitoxin module